MCAACYLSGGSGERKQLQGKFWGKTALESKPTGRNVYLRQHPPSPPPYTPTSVGGFVFVCALRFV